jgi:MerR family transcriptional regulator, light-induced transcriptional regulator
MSEHAVLRIGEISKRTGVSPELLRAWERRYDLLQPRRSSGGLRLYSDADVERVQLMRRHIASGLATAEAAALALRGGASESADRPALEAAHAELRAALDHFDEPEAQLVFDRLLGIATVDTLIGQVVIPYLQDLGARWARGEASIAQEHFASGIVRGRLLGMARGWGLGLGPLAVLACLPGEQHDLGLIAFGLVLRERGWRIVYLGTDAPIDTIAEVSARSQPDLVVLSAVSPERLALVRGRLGELAQHQRLAVGGGAAQDDEDSADGILRLSGDPVAEAARVTALESRAG